MAVPNTLAALQPGAHSLELLDENFAYLDARIVGNPMLKTDYDTNADGKVDLAAGGTGASTAADARTNLGLGSAAVLDATAFGASLIDDTDASAARTTLDAAQSTWTQTGTGAVARTVHEKLREIVSLEDFGALGDGIVVTSNTTISSGSPNLTVSSASFINADIGKQIKVPGAGVAGAPLYASIISVLGASQVTLDTNASTSLSAVSSRIVYGTDDSAAIQAAIDHATSLVVSSGTYSQVTCAVFAPPGRYIIGNGSTIRLKRGLSLKGASRLSTHFEHFGGNVDAFDTDSASTSNQQIELLDFTLWGDQETTYGVDVNNSNYDSRIKITVRDCKSNIRLTDCWAINLDDSDFQSAVEYNAVIQNGTAANVYGGRFDAAGIDNVLVQPSTLSSTVSLTFFGSRFQRAQQSGARLIDVDCATFFGCWLEGNNKANGNHADIEWLTGAMSRGLTLTVVGGFFNATYGGLTNRIINATTPGRISVMGATSYSEGFSYKYLTAFVLGSSVSSLNIVGSTIDADTRISAASTATKIFDNEMGDFNFGAVGQWDFETTSNLYLRLNSPSNRRNEIRFASGGTDKWFIGRGDTDEPNADDLYIARLSGGGNPPDLRFNDTNGNAEFRGLWNAAHPVIGTIHLWDDGSGRLRWKTSAPTSATDGTLI